MQNKEYNIRVSIVGGGIAGLCAAIALRKAGYSPTVFEAAPVLQPVGAGLGLAPNAIKAFQKLGIADQVIPVGRQLPYFQIRNADGQVLSHNDSYLISERYGLDNLSVHRSALHEVLLSQLESGQVQVGKRAIKLEKKDKEISIHFADGSTHATDYLIIADGINSALRNQVVPDATLRYAGYTCWRGVVSNSTIGLEGAFETWGAEGRVGMLPLAGDQLYWFACINAKPDDPKYKQFKVHDLVRHFSGFHKPVPEALALTTEQQLLHNDLYDLKPLKQFAYDNILLLGDAAHATTPNMGQGACQAVEDAAVLLNELTRTNDLKQAFQAFEKRRLDRTAYITNQSRRVGQMAQWTNPLLIRLRNLALRNSPERLRYSQFDKLYNVDF
jgi:2-polyprenyl-6-methoxyphenol hydroxylase-like FAD-dependent oxidoreductase